MQMRSISYSLPNDDSRAATTSDSVLVPATGLVLTVALIMLFGLTMLYSTSYTLVGTSYFVKQLVWAGIGVTGAVAVILVGYRLISDLSLVWLLVAVGLLIVADFFCPAIKGAHRWIVIPKIGSIQPSELAKLAVVIFLAKYCAENMRYLNTFAIKNSVFPAAFVCAVMLGLIFLGKDWGTTALLAAVAGLMFFIAGVRLLYLLVPTVIILPSAFFWLRYMDPERWSRLTSFLNPELCQQADGYQLWNSFLALGSGNFSGLGFTLSRLKNQYLPEAHTDFILSIVGEELGYLFLCLVVLAYATFLVFAVMISLRARNTQGMLLGFGVTAVIIIQAIINIGVISGSLPTKGMPAPFISYGGSNLLMCLLGTALLLSVALDSAFPDYNKKLLAAIRTRLQHKKKST